MEDTTETVTQKEWKVKLRNAQELLELFKRQAYKEHML